MVCMIMGKQKVLNLVSIHSGFQQIAQRPGTKIHKEQIVGFDKIAGGRPVWMEIGAGS